MRMGEASPFMAGMREIQIFDVPIFLMPIVGFRFRAHADRRTLRALKAQLKLRERRATPFIGQGVREPPVELRPLPVVHSYGQGGAGKREAP